MTLVGKIKSKNLSNFHFLWFSCQMKEEEKTPSMIQLRRLSSLLFRRYQSSISIPSLDHFFKEIWIFANHLSFERRVNDNSDGIFHTVISLLISEIPRFKAAHNFFPSLHAPFFFLQFPFWSWISLTFSKPHIIRKKKMQLDEWSNEHNCLVIIYRDIAFQNLTIFWSRDFPEGKSRISFFKKFSSLDQFVGACWIWTPAKNLEFPPENISQNLTWKKFRIFLGWGKNSYPVSFLWLKKNLWIWSNGENLKI